MDLESETTARDAECLLSYVGYRFAARRDVHLLKPVAKRLSELNFATLGS
ncbi:hypothetical protein SXCC_04852 [Gluconacetobacter sp. SXCC-1]|nr:hypothetical protein SXCC_04852 [Gluconacetobacter sp. SXCC-1]